MLPPRRAEARLPPPGSAQPQLVGWLSGWPACWLLLSLGCGGAQQALTDVSAAGQGWGRDVQIDGKDVIV